MSAPGRSPELSDDEYIDLVKSTCDLTGAPMAPTQTIYDYHDLPITDQTLKNHLERLSEDGLLTHIEVGSGFAWSVPIEGQSGGKIDFSDIVWDNVDIGSIPRENLKEHPNYQSVGERHVTKANNVFEYALYITFAGLVILLVDSLIIEIPYSAAVDFGGIAFIGGFLLIFLSTIIMVVFIFVDKLSQSDAFQAIKDTLGDLLPFDVYKEEGSVTLKWR